MKTENIIAGVLSLLIPGLGQLYQNRNKDAIWFFVVWVFSILFCITLPLALFIWIWAVVDAVLYKS